MTRSPNRYLDEPQLYKLSTLVTDYKPLLSGGWAIASAETIFRPEGGGQPRDYGSVEIDGQAFKVSALEKGKGKIYVGLPDLKEEPPHGLPITMALDSERRDKLCKSHTLQHILSAATHEIIPNADIVETGIFEDASGGWVTVQNGGLEASALAEIDQRVRSTVISSLPVWAEKMKSIEHGEFKFGSLFRNDSQASLSGKVRVVVIEDYDANCCSGTHWMSTNVGPYSMSSQIMEEPEGPVRIAFQLAESWMYWFGEHSKSP